MEQEIRIHTTSGIIIKKPNEGKKVTNFIPSSLCQGALVEHLNKGGTLSVLKVALHDETGKETHVLDAEKLKERLDAARRDRVKKYKR